MPTDGSVAGENPDNSSRTSSTSAAVVRKDGRRRRLEPEVDCRRMEKRRTNPLLPVDAINGSAFQCLPSASVPESPRAGCPVRGSACCPLTNNTEAAAQSATAGSSSPGGIFQNRKNSQDSPALSTCPRTIPVFEGEVYTGGGPQSGVSGWQGSRGIGVGAIRVGTGVILKSFASICSLMCCSTGWTSSSDAGRLLAKP